MIQVDAERASELLYKAARGASAAMRRFNDGLWLVMEARYRQDVGRLPGSNRTRRLRKKRRKAVLEAELEAMAQSEPAAHDVDPATTAEQATEHGDSVNANLLAGAPVKVHFQSEALPASVEKDPLAVEEILGRQDAMSVVEANLIANAIEGGQGWCAVQAWLRDVIECDGSANESKLAAILRGILLVCGRRHEDAS